MPKRLSDSVGRWHGCCVSRNRITKKVCFMKRIFFTLLLSTLLTTASFAQRFQAGIRAGANVADFSIPTVSFDEGLLRDGKSKMGFEAALVTRLALTQHLHIQAEFEYDRLNYSLKLTKSASQREFKLHANRIEIPLMLGLNVGPLRLFCGASFRVGHNEKSSLPSMLKVKFDNSKVAMTGGIGLNLRKFFIEGRLTGYPGSSRNIITLNGVDRTVTAKRDIKWSMTAGFLF